MIVWIEHRTGIGGVAAAGEAEVLAHGLPHNFAAGIQNAGDNGGIELRCVSLQHRGAIHHRHARHTHVVLDSDALACQNAPSKAPRPAFWQASASLSRTTGVWPAARV